MQIARSLYHDSAFDEALAATETALKSAGTSVFSDFHFQANLLMANIFSRKAHYLHSAVFFDHAAVFFDLLKTQLDSYQRSVQFHFSRIDYFIFRAEYDKARQTAENIIKIIRQENDEVTLGKALSLLSQVYLSSNDTQNAAGVIAEAEQIMTKLVDPPEALQLEVYHQISQLLIKKQLYDEARSYSRTLLELSRKNNDIEKELTGLNNLAICYGVRSDYKQALQYLLDALGKSTAIQYRQFIAQCSINIGTLYAHLFNYEEALARYETVIRDFVDVIERSTLAIVYNNAGNIYYSTDRAALALEYFHNALSISREEKRRDLLAMATAQLGRTYTDLGDLVKAKSYALDALQMFEETGVINGTQINLISLADIHFKHHEIDEAVDLLNKGIAVARKLKDNISEIRGYKLLSDIYKVKEDYRKALEYQQLFAQKQETFNKQRSSLRILDLEIQYAIREQQKEIKQLTKENQYQALLLQQSDQIAQQNKKLKQVIEELKQFTYVASHDLKEPLRMIGSYSQLLHRHFKTQLDEETGMYFGFVLEGAERMNALLDDLLKYATIGRSDNAFVNVRLDDAVELSKINLRLRIKESGARIICENLPEVKSVPSLLSQLFQNLISNAIKFRNEGITPEIRVSAELKEQAWEIRVKDNGIGVAPEFKERIFVIFQRLHARTEYRGTGIGLAICQKIVNTLGGKIWVESEEGEGACFKFTLPAN